jgi:CRP-like cAMP-binding protein/tetratricopeptide (TPR) repeat protein
MVLESIELFNGLSQHELREIAAITSEVTFDRGAVIFAQGDFSRDFFIIRNGQVEISVKNFLNQPRVLTVLKNGEFFGEMALFDKDSARSATAVALQKVNLLRIPGDSFEKLLREKSTISFKLLGTLSKRLRDANLWENVGPIELPKCHAKVITIASARNGFGKTTLATTMAWMLATELPRRVLFLDLDVHYGDGTFMMGVFSSKSILNLAEANKAEIDSPQKLNYFLTNNSEHLYTLAAPQDFLEGEKVTEEDLAAIIKVCRPFFDYIIIDTDSAINDLFLSAIDMADKIFFLVDLHDAMAIKSTSRFMQALGRLNLPEPNANILVTMTGNDFDPEKVRHLFKYRLLGGLPRMEGYIPEHGKTPFQTDPNSAFCEVIRHFLRIVLGETSITPRTDSGFLFRLLFSRNPDAPAPIPSPVPPLPSADPLQINPEQVAAILKDIRLNMTDGYLEKARLEALRLVEFCPHAAEVYEVLGEIFSISGDNSRAIEACRKAIELDPHDHMALGLWAKLVPEENNQQTALKVLQEKLQAHPDFPDLHNDMGRLLYLFGHHTEASQHLLKALEINPDFHKARINLALCLSESGQVDDAIRQLMLIETKGARVYYLLGTFFYRTGRFFHALKAFTRAAEFNPGYFDLSERLDQLRKYFHRITGLLDMHRELLRDHPDFPDLHFKMGNLELMLGRHDEARKSFQRAAQLNPRFQDAIARLDQLENLREFSIPCDASIQEDLADFIGREHGRRFHLQIRFGTFQPRASGEIVSEPFAITVKNLRTETTMYTPISLKYIQEGCVPLNCSVLGEVRAGDLLAIRVEEKDTRDLVAVMPHQITEAEIKSGEGIVDVETQAEPKWLYSLAYGADLSVPIRHFLVSLHCPRLAELLRTHPGEYQAEFLNFATEARATGEARPEGSDGIDFVFESANGKDVVRLGDQLKLQVVDQEKKEIMGMGFPVLREDLESFSKSIALDVLDIYFPERPAPAVGKVTGKTLAAGSSLT